MLLRTLRRAGILGVNRRNRDYLLRCNERRLFPLVDDKLATKSLCERAGIAVPQTLGVAKHHFEIAPLVEKLSSEDSFVIKPARGAMGNGIMVVIGRDGADWRRSGGRTLGRGELAYHAAGIVSGLYALGGHQDVAFAEERLVAHPALRELGDAGVPDLRVIVYRGVPVMAMTRIPTRSSGGRANLHQGAIGIGVDLGTGRTVHAVRHNRTLRRNPDGGELLLGQVIPHFGRALGIAVAATDETGLQYVGADVVVDERFGPVILELNARPGLSIQVANRAGLLPRLDAVDARLDPDATRAERVLLGREIGRGWHARRAA
ncbi:MAG: alpha-L-glutamate ligase-like protein [Myxococcales bacterium]|nr:alpha-L-glutamate ligase-like protein [Myxococcales bacterium]